MVKSGSYKKRERHDYTEYTLDWSDYIIGSKFNILQKFTEMTGIYVVFFLNKYKRLSPLLLGSAWTTGFRPSLLRLYSDIPLDALPKNIRAKAEKNKLYIKFIQVFSIDDQENILYKLKGIYPEAFFDSNGLPEPEDLFSVKIVDPTKIYFKNKNQPDI